MVQPIVAALMAYGLKRLHMFPVAFDVGIAEEHAVTLAAGRSGGRVKNRYLRYIHFPAACDPDPRMHTRTPSFRQRYKRELCLARLIEETHQVFLRHIPSVQILKHDDHGTENKWELSDMIKYAVDFPTPTDRVVSSVSCKQWSERIVARVHPVGKKEFDYRDIQVTSSGCVRIDG
ncbi:MAG: hypothetical protein ACLVCH_11845 [Roseburia inulinivorans]